MSPRAMTLLVLGLVTGLSSPLDAHAITSRRAGWWTSAAGGLGAGGTPFAGVGWIASAGIWRGNYDSVGALGRHVGVGATLRQDINPGKRPLRTAALLELRRGYDLLVAGGHGYIAAGPQWQNGQLGAVALAGVGLKYRPHPLVSPTLRLEGGVAWHQERVQARMGVMLGVELGSLFRKRTSSAR